MAEKRVSKYQCPADFVPFSHDGGALLDDDVNKELWLIKAPARFEPQCFATLKVPLSGVEMVQSCGKTPQNYSVLSGRMAPSDLHLLVSNENSQALSLSTSGFAGVLNISESYGNCSENKGPVSIPTAPAPCIPPGLKQRFQPFGSSIAAHMKDQVTIVSPTAPKRTRLDLNEGEERKKKKRKKEKRNREVHSEKNSIKQEQEPFECGQIQFPEPMENQSTEMRRKKKKMKKEKDRRSEETVDASFMFKMEPLDTSYGDIDTPGKSKKKKKKARNE
ncbi:CD3e molecule, epsilon associated protein [Myxocyprinus asiaticus]|uniref:CD3e molecule, epsilon associated protein n=1 Tax=Myxocyprinus asiaticus TaxID=70543 RepID=UPI0022239C9E|nr:CD3e molecule, epsilon associated protein [Myxocyprinus asiaticus]